MPRRTISEELKDQEKLDAAVASATRTIVQERDQATAEVQELRRTIGFYQGARQAKIAPPTWTVKPKAKRAHAGIVTAQLTDTHFDEVITPAEVGFLNAYDRKIAEQRFRRWVDKVVTLPREYVTGLTLEGIVIPATGDILSGDIHAELKESNEAHLLASVLHWTEQIIAGLETIEREYPAVHVAAVVGNHGRTTVRPVFKGRAESNVEWLLWSVVRDRLADRGSKVTVDVSTSMDHNLEIYGRNHLLTHGDQFKGGTGISGAYAPLSLGQHRKSVRQMAADQPMSLMVMGHFHQLLDLPGLIVGGSMKGYDEYAYGLNLRPEQAGQMLWITTPERGKTMTMPVYLQDRKAEGW